MKRTARLIVDVVYDDETTEAPGPVGPLVDERGTGFAWEPDVSDWHPIPGYSPAAGRVDAGEIRVVEVVDVGLFDGETYDPATGRITDTEEDR